MTASLFVPIRLEALAVNDAVSTDTFRRWLFLYSNLQYFGSPVPEPGEGDMPRPPGGEANIEKGVYLHWTLPRALRTQPRGSDAYPHVPNRWLVVRISQGTPRPTAAWVVESDCPSADGGVEHLVHPDVVAAWMKSADQERRSFPATGINPLDPSAPVCTIGRVFSLPWKERTRPGEPLFLTAVSAANPVFSAYVPHNQNVFSFFDDLDGQSKGPLSYYVVGWYSDPACDILAPGAASASATEDLLHGLRWASAGGAPPAASRSLYCGTIFALDPDPGETTPDPFRAASSGRGLNVAVGNSTVDAFMALLARNTDVPATTLDLLRALQYDGLHLLNRPGGRTALDEMARRSWFTAKPGGTRWTVVASAEGQGHVEPATDEASGLQQLNADQADQDRAVAELFALQSQVLGRWIQYGFTDPNSPAVPAPADGFTDETFSTFRESLGGDLNPSTQGSSAARLVAAFERVIDGAKRLPVPGGRRSEAHENEPRDLKAPAFARQFGVGGVLKPVAAEPYHIAGDPVVVVSGIDPPPATLPEDGLVVRSQDQLVGRLSIGGRTVDAAALAECVAWPGGLTALPEGVAELLTECGLLDPANATALGFSTPPTSWDTATIGPAIAPAYGLKPWTQPWEPMFLEWRVAHVPLPASYDGKPCWTFDGTDYTLTEAGAQLIGTLRANDGDAPGSHIIKGMSLLGPQTQQILTDRLRGFVAAFGADDKVEELDEAVEDVLGWKLLAQDLGGFGARLALRDPKPFRRPLETDQIGIASSAKFLAELTGFRVREGKLPDDLLGAVTAIPRLDPRDLPFSGSRQGLAWFTSLMLYDKFGRAFKVIDGSGLGDFRNFELDIDPALGGGPALDGRENAWRGRQMIFPPRLLQGARLDFDLVDVRDDSKRVDVDASANPVCGFVLPNHLDRSIGLYAPDGAALGEICSFVDNEGTERVKWQPMPGAADIEIAAPGLADMPFAPGFKTPAGLSAFLDAIDATLWTVDPLGNRVDQNLSVLIGRPLALVRARVAFALDGPPLTDPGWVATAKALEEAAVPPPFLALPLSIRLGDQASRDDGIIGYFEGTSFQVFNSVSVPDAGQDSPQLRPIGPLGPAGGDNYLTVTCTPGDGKSVTILADPRASLHAFTGLLPVRRLAIPPRFVEHPLRSIAVGFRLGPVLTGLRDTPRPSTPAPAHPRSVTIPIPAEQRGTWTWWEQDAEKADTWSSHGVLNAVGQARLGPVPSSLREGILQLSIDLEQAKTQGDIET